ncbi:MAG: hypothetical protein ABJA90_04745 [Ginsengibacter sp.]
MRLQMGINLLSRRFKLIITILVLLNIFFLAGTWLYNTAGENAGNITKFLLLQLDLAHENNLAAWYSSMLWLLVALMYIFCFMMDRGRFLKKTDRWINAGWIILSLAFAVLSLDELGSFHETIGDSRLFEIFGKSEGWEVFYILVMLVGVFMILFSWVRLRRMPLATAFMIVGALLLLSNPMQEDFEIESMRSSVNPLLWRRPVIFTLLEEGSEIFATICFLVSTMIYYVYAKRQLQKLEVTSSATQTFGISKSKLKVLTICFIAVSGVLLAIVDRYVQRDAGNEVGIPKNWFPSMITFIVFVVSLYSYINKSTQSRDVFLYMSMLAVLISAYCGIDLYEHHFNEMITGEKIFDWIMILLVIILAFRFLKEQQGITSKLLIIFWAVFTCLAFYFKSYTAEFIFAGFSIFLIALVSNLYFDNNINSQKEFI